MYAQNRKVGKSRDKDKAKKTEREITNNIQKLKENTQKTKSKRVTRTPLIPKKNTGDNPLQKKKLAVPLFF
jgi:hypothetical protein